MKLKKTYKFAFKSSVYIAVIAFLFIFLGYYFFFNEINSLFAFILSIIIFVFTFFIIQYRVERFIYKRIKKIYDDISLLEIEGIGKKKIANDIETLSKEVQKFAEDKRLEIETLQIREQYRREFLGNVSHELKTPLFTVQGYLLTLIDGAINDKIIRKKYLERANISVERLINIVKDLDMINKLEAGNLSLTIETFDIIGLIRNVFELLEIKANKRNIALIFDKKYDTPILVRADEKKIEQILMNLLENAIKYGKTKGKTIVSVKNHSSKKFIIAIKDDGEGIQPQHISRIFERFYRVDQSRSRDQGGSGLGLSIVKHIIEAHNQEVFAESEYGKGSTFSFTLKKLK
jgi:two-component system phosphate regulon sensor histidine kinase PhoR